MKIRQLLQPIASETQVASVELFQGQVWHFHMRYEDVADSGISQERKVIIMSTVRSTQDLMAYDLKHTLGFVGNPRRFNGTHLLLLQFMFDQCD
jgi:helicase MOV-10